MTVLVPATSGGSNIPDEVLASNEETGIPSEVATTVVQYTAIGGKKRIHKISVSGNYYAEWEVFINLVSVEKQITGPDPTKIFWLNVDLPLSQTVVVKVTHHYSVLDANFNGTIYGF